MFQTSTPHTAVKMFSELKSQFLLRKFIYIYIYSKNNKLDNTLWKYNFIGWDKHPVSFQISFMLCLLLMHWNNIAKNLVNSQRYAGPAIKLCLVLDRIYIGLLKSDSLSVWFLQNRYPVHMAATPLNEQNVPVPKSCTVFCYFLFITLWILNCNHVFLRIHTC